MRYLRPKGLPPAGSASNLVPRRAFKTQRSVLNWMALGLLGLVGCPTAQPTPDPLAATSGTIEWRILRIDERGRASLRRRPGGRRNRPAG